MTVASKIRAMSRSTASLVAVGAGGWVFPNLVAGTREVWTSHGEMWVL